MLEVRVVLTLGQGLDVISGLSQPRLIVCWPEMASCELVSSLPHPIRRPGMQRHAPIIVRGKFMPGRAGLLSGLS